MLSQTSVFLSFKIYIEIRKWTQIFLGIHFTGVLFVLSVWGIIFALLKRIMNTNKLSCWIVDPRLKQKLIPSSGFLLYPVMNRPTLKRAICCRLSNKCEIILWPSFAGGTILCRPVREQQRKREPFSELREKGPLFKRLRGQTEQNKGITKHHNTNRVESVVSWLRAPDYSQNGIPSQTG